VANADLSASTSASVSAPTGSDFRLTSSASRSSRHEQSSSSLKRARWAPTASVRTARAVVPRRGQRILQHVGEARSKSYSRRQFEKISAMATNCGVLPTPRRRRSRPLPNACSREPRRVSGRPVVEWLLVDSSRKCGSVMAWSRVVPARRCFPQTRSRERHAWRWGIGDAAVPSRRCWPGWRASRRRCCFVGLQASGVGDDRFTATRVPLEQQECPQQHVRGVLDGGAEKQAHVHPTSLLIQPRFRCGSHSPNRRIIPLLGDAIPKRSTRSGG